MLIDKDVQAFTIIEKNFGHFLHAVLVRENKVMTTQSIYKITCQFLFISLVIVSIDTFCLLCFVCVFLVLPDFVCSVSFVVCLFRFYNFISLNTFVESPKALH